MTIDFENPASGMKLRDLLEDPGFSRRPSSIRADRRFEALERLAQSLSDTPSNVLQKLVGIAVEFCGADSSGISLEERDNSGKLRFRWIAISGSFEKYINGVTPRFFSPCGTCLSTGRAQLYSLKQPYYEFLGVEAEPIHEGILIPWISDNVRGTLWAVSHREGESFDFNDYILLNSLANFASMAIRNERQQELLRERERLKASAARANELAHQINNPLQTLANCLYIASQGDPETASYVGQAMAELRTLSELVAGLLKPEGTCEAPMVQVEKLPDETARPTRTTAA